MSSVDKIVFSELLGENGKLQDVKFAIMGKSGEIEGELKAHKLILSLVSEVFEKQFYGPMAENNKQAGIFIAGNIYHSPLLLFRICNILIWICTITF